ncbi:LAMI_0G15170g1_1 [Lachancea mirantina]|uniref:NADH-cytochrome b5 reductase n=1 Tax=Lachancea mirantina TaxID=1230905 RepID=A0A1G4KCF8_9SACH|nr:LAMI_0G15170g1_1 [Lachancea mirantina]
MVEDKRKLLDEPLHGIYIPTALMLVGVAITAYMSGNLLSLWILPFAALVLGVRFVAAYRRRKSVSEDKWTALELEEQTVISKNSAIYRFKLKTSLEALNVPTGHHLAVKVPVDGQEHIRYYTPISPAFETGHFDIIVKSYPDGTVSKYFASLKPGSLVNFKGPVGRFNYVPNSFKHIGLIAGGSGITPMLQVLNKIITTPEDFTKISLIYANDTENDILLKEELDEMAEVYPNFDVHYVLRYPTGSWNGDSGLVSKEIMQKYLPEPADENRLLISGRPEMVKMLLNYAEELGWPKGKEKSAGDDQVFAF